MRDDRMAFDLGELSCAINGARRERGTSLAALSRQVGVSASTIRRFKTATDAEADGVLALVDWVGVPPEQFVAGSTIEGVLLGPREGGVIRVDMNEIASVTGRRNRDVGSRTSIQRLVEVARASDRTVASLTRWSDV